MEKKIILDSLKKQFSKSIKDVSVQFGDCIIRIEKKSFCDTIRFLREEPFRFNILLDLTCVDYYGQDERFEMVYHLFSLSNKFRLRLKVRLSEKDLSIESLTPFWENANWLEREVFDMFGVHF
ncbi:MAG: NADH-quinone oxidoreductase subunit C, partial [Candidatus Aminicenantes bacterium]|nr:NADH-quinone oxidoreductase subunit C [Candidatus Aminicenantes bacterium]